MSTADKAMDNLPLGYCFQLASQLTLETAFGAVVKKECKLTDKKIKALQQQAMTEYQEKQLQPA